MLIGTNLCSKEWRWRKKKKKKYVHWNQPVEQRVEMANNGISFGGLQELRGPGLGAKHREPRRKTARTNILKGKKINYQNNYTS